MSFHEDFELIESEPTLPDTSRLAKGAREIRDSFTQKDRERIQAAKPATAAWAEIHIKQLPFAPTNIELASLVARVERGDASDSNKNGFLRVVEATFPNFRRGWLSDLRKAVVNVLAAPQRAEARGEDRNVVNADDFQVLVRYGLKELKGSQGDRSKPQLFRYGSEIAEIQVDPLTGAASIATLSYQVFKARMNTIAVYRKAVGDGGTFQGVSIPDDVCQMLYAQPELPLPILRGITRTPVFDADGNLIRTPGFHEDSGLFYEPPPGFRVELPRGGVSAEDVEQAIADLADLFCDFEMDGMPRKDFLAAVLKGEGKVPPSFLSCVAWMLEQPCRALIGGPVMPLLVSKTTPGAGGGLLAKVMQTIVQGSTAARQLAKNEDEKRKAAYTLLLGGPSTVFWDNLRAGREVDSPTLASLFTEPIWTDRELGRSGERSLMVTASFLLVGNRPLFSDELRRRLSLCELLPQVADPAARTGFVHADLFGDVKRDRAKYVRALLVLALNWIQKGSPKPMHSTAPGSYEEWHRVIVGILEAAADHWTTWGTNRAALAQVAGSGDAEEIEELLHLWAAEYGIGLGQKVEASDLCKMVSLAKLELPLRVKPGGGECEYSSKQVGSYLSGFSGRIFRIEVTEKVRGKDVTTERELRVRQHDKRGNGGYPWILEEIKREAPKKPEAVAPVATADAAEVPLAQPAPTPKPATRPGRRSGNALAQLPEVTVPHPFAR